jgi:ABC-type phosphate transport system substrate-binding protein
MSAFKQKLARLGATAGVLAATTAAIMAVGGVGASSAFATIGTQCSGEGIHGEGSSLQREAQNIWTTAGFNTSTDASACSGTQGSKAKPAATYTVTSSGTALKEWGVGSGSLGTAGVGDNFIGSDDAPSGTSSTGQIHEMITALRAHGTTNSTNLVVIPVTQTAIAIPVNLPATCTLTQITNANLQAAFAGTAKTWGAIGGEGAGCTAAIKRVVRKDGSGTTYQFKHYLSKSNTGKLCTKELGEVTWAELQNESEVEVGGKKFTPNLIWPNCSGTTEIVLPESTGGGSLMSKVSATDGSIGYAALPDAEGANKGAEVSILKVQNGEESGKPTYAAPNTGSSLANCASVKYNLPAGVSTWAEAGTTANVNWSGVYEEPESGGTKYSICTLTWNVAATDSSDVWGSAKATTVRNYLTYEITKTGGQANIVGKWYAAMPNSTASTSSNPQLAAEEAVKQIN